MRILTINPAFANANSSRLVSYHTARTSTPFPIISSIYTRCSPLLASSSTFMTMHWKWAGLPLGPNGIWHHSYSLSYVTIPSQHFIFSFTGILWNPALISSWLKMVVSWSPANICCCSPVKATMALLLQC